MADMTITLAECDPADHCTLCEAAVESPAGPRLVLAESREPVCRACGKRHAPALVALLELAQVAHRVGRIGRHTIVPPMSALLDLARAAERFNDAAPHDRRQAA
jgi:hypothetical protein